MFSKDIYLLRKIMKRKIKEGPLGSISSTLFQSSNKFGLGGKEQLSKPENREELIDPEEEMEKRLFPGEEKDKAPELARDDLYMKEVSVADPSRIFYRDMPGTKQDMLVKRKMFVPIDTGEDPLPQPKGDAQLFPSQKAEPVLPGNPPGTFKGKLKNDFASGPPSEVNFVSDPIDLTKGPASMQYRVDWISQIDPDDPSYNNNQTRFLKTGEGQAQPAPAISHTLVKPRRFVPKVVDRQKMEKELKEKISKPVVSKTLNKLEKQKDFHPADENAKADKEIPELPKDFDHKGFKISSVLWPEKDRNSAPVLSEENKKFLEEEILNEGFWNFLKNLFHKLFGGGYGCHWTQTPEEFKSDFIRLKMRVERTYSVAQDYGIEDADLTRAVELFNSKITNKQFCDMIKDRKLETILHRVSERIRRINKKEAERNIPT